MAAEDRQSKVFTIPPGESFLDALAAGLLERYPDPEALSDVRIFLPTRRAGRGLREAFLRQSGGKPLLLPVMQPLGDLDAEELSAEDEGFGAGWPDAALLDPAFAPLKRQLLLAELVIKWHEAQERAISPEQAVLLAAELARLLDQVETEGLSFEALKDLVTDARFAEHWNLTLDFLAIVTENWPKIEEEYGEIGAARRRRLLLERQAEAWDKTPPEGPVIAAGSTGSIPATRALISAIARLPMGMVVLPGLDHEMDDEVWEAVKGDPTHPQHVLAELLNEMQVGRAEVILWPATAKRRSTPQSRARLINRALWPAQSTPGWRRLDPIDCAQALDRQVLRIDCPDSEREAQVIGLLLREALEDPQKTAALVTPDRDLARRVAAALARWGVEVDDSAGRPLAATPPGVFLRAIARAVEERAAPIALLSLLKHPLAALGEAPGAFRRKVRTLEVALLRGPRPAPGFLALRRDLAANSRLDEAQQTSLSELLGRIETALGPLAEALKGHASLAEVARAHMAAAEALAASDEEEGPLRLWSGESGLAASRFFEDLSGLGANSRLAEHGYAAVLESLMASREVRRGYGGHPRLQILGPLEARLWQTDRMILAGLNEGTWPAETDPGPWMSRGMRKDFKLPPVERRVGLAAHDFCQAFSAPEVYLTRAERVEGAPSVPSRWLLRLEAALQAQGETPEALLSWNSRQWVHWVKQLDQPAKVAPWPRAAYSPPLEARPTRLSVSRIEEWLRDPYMLYARAVLKLTALDPLDADASAAERGEIIHKIMQRFVEQTADGLPEDPGTLLETIGQEVFEALAARPSIQAIWWPRFERLIPWIIEMERHRRAPGVELLAEIKGETTLDGFTLTAKADRLEKRPGGRLTILDYKTGAAPSAKSVLEGASPQLPLEAVIARAGGFAGISAEEAAGIELLYWELKGRQDPGRETFVDPKDQDLVEEARTGLLALIEAYRDPEMPYMAQPRGGLAPRFNDYDYLERVAEWSAGGGGGEE